ncbi:MAG: hypothetical protein C4519_24730 [Desulfobacteraceae bacterium]|nr:MAG: hypothetical protein C4519_24730 [Desulfobacteraceae bacterium]
MNEEPVLIALLGTEAEDCEALRRIIEAGPYRAVPYSKLADLESGLRSAPCLAAILDIDSVPLENRTIRQLTIAFPGVSFFCTSRYRFHPELKDAICYHLFACLNKPVDYDELHYFLKCILRNETDSRGPPDL